MSYMPEMRTGRLPKFYGHIFLIVRLVFYFKLKRTCMRDDEQLSLLISFMMSREATYGLI